MSAASSLPLIVKHDQATFDFILGTSSRELLSVEEVAGRLGKHRDFIYELIGEGALEVHRRPGKERSSMMITRRSVIAWLFKAADYVPEDFLETLLKLARTLPESVRERAHQEIRAGLFDTLLKLAIQLQPHARAELARRIAAGR
jgi:excisionase family DNA binding protein